MTRICWRFMRRRCRVSPQRHRESQRRERLNITMLRCSSLFLIVLFCVLCVFVVDSAADWPVFRGNALQTGVASSELPEKLEILWKFEAGEFEGTAAIAGG